MEHRGFEPLTSTMRTLHATKAYVIYPRYSLFPNALDCGCNCIIEDSNVFRRFTFTSNFGGIDEEMSLRRCPCPCNRCWLPYSYSFNAIILICFYLLPQISNALTFPAFDMYADAEAKTSCILSGNETVLLKPGWTITITPTNCLVVPRSSLISVL